MNRSDEIDIKQGQIHTLLEARGASALWLRRNRNVAWFTAGADPTIDVSAEYGSYSVLITHKDQRRWVVTDNIEITRLRAEERFGDLGFDYVESPWHTPSSTLSTTPGILTDEGEIEDAIQAIRCVLTEGEVGRLRALGRAAADALEAAARTIHPGDTELQISTRLDAACRERGLLAVVNMAAVDERISKFRHPLTTDKVMKKVAMMVVCARRGGLIVSASRLVQAGRLTDDLEEKLFKVAHIDAEVMAASKPGRTLGDVFVDLQAAYAKHSEDDQWTKHHQGGLAGYKPREIIARPGDPTVLQAGHMLAWNPSIVGCKSEDTILLARNGFEIVTAAQNWPTVNFEVEKYVIQRPGILEI